MNFEKFPETVQNPGISSGPTKVYLGLGEDGDIIWDTEKASNILIVGHAGAGKTVFLDNLRSQICRLSSEWEVLSVDPRRLDNEAYVRGEQHSIVSPGLHATALALRRAHDLILERYERMFAENVTKFSDLADNLPRVAVIIDEAFGVFTKSAFKNEAKEINHLMVDTNLALMKLIYKTGKAAGVHLVLATQRPDHSVLNSDRLEDFPCRIVLGRTDRVSSQLALGNHAATEIPQVLGRGYIQIDGFGQMFLSYAMIDR